MAGDKDTIYIDIDDEITGVIDKLTNSKSQVVALVLPKRAAVFQSIVNMKLLKRAADSSKKNLVLITSEPGLLPLAGAAGIHVAKTLSSKPAIPTGPQLDTDKEETIEEDGQVVDDQPVDTSKSIGALAAMAAAEPEDGVETLTLDDDDLPPEAVDAGKTPVKPKSAKPKVKKDKKLAIPDFDRFRLKMALAGLVAFLLIFGIIFGAVVLPSATISIKTDATNVDNNINLNLSTTATELKTTDNTLPSKVETQSKTYTQTVPTTGQKNNGNKASGTATIINCGPSPVTLNGGTGFSGSGNTYISQSSVTVPPSDFTFGGKCKNNGNASVNVIAQNGGSSYNIPAGTNLTIANNPAYLTAQAGTISGGTDNIVQSVNQNDINSAKSKINTDDPTIKQALNDQLKKDKMYPIEATYTASTPNTTTSANVGDAANNVTVTETVNYSMFGVHEDDLKTVLNNSIKSQIDTSKQSILDDGLDKATYNVTNISPTSAQLTMSATATAGPDLDTNTIKTNAAGKKPGEVKSQLANNPDVKSVDVHLSPFWVSSVPKKTSKIKVVIAKPTNTAKTSSNASNP